MNTQIKSLCDFLEQNKYYRISNNMAENGFGNYLLTYTDGIILIKISRDRSFESIDIGRLDDEENAFDTALFKAMFFHEKNLKLPTHLDDITSFLISHLSFIEEALSTTNYSNTIETIKKMKVLRAKQMFPNIDIDSASKREKG